MLQVQGIPMKQRTLPESFWIPPETADKSHMENPVEADVMTNVGNIRITSPPDTNLLFSLFKILESNQQDNENAIYDGGPPFSVDDEQTSISKARKRNQDDLNYDDVALFATNDDPYLNRTETNVITQTEIKSNYSDLLSDLVVQL